MAESRGDRVARRFVIAGVALAAIGLACMAGGVMLIAWRLAAPEAAVLLPPGFVPTAETPTPGVWREPVAPPSLDREHIVMLPVSEYPTATPTGPRVNTRTPVPTLTNSPSPTVRATTVSPATLTPTDMPRVTSTFERATATATHTPTPTLPATATPPAIPDTIRIAAIGLEAPVVPVGQHPVTVGSRIYSQWDVPNDYAAGWHQNSAPLGVPGNTVLNGHHNVYDAVFGDLIDLAPGDRLMLDANGKSFTYIVAQTMTLLEQDQPAEIREENARWILPTNDERVTLVTCWPPYATTHRLVIIALPAPTLDRPAELP